LDNLNALDVKIIWDQTDLDNHEAYPIASDNLAVIVNQANPISSLTKGELIEIYRQQQKSWTDKSGAIRELSLWVYGEHDPVQKAFATIFSNNPLKIGSVNIAPDPDAIVSAISSDPNALGFIPRSWLVNGLREVTITPPLLDSYPILVVLPDQANDPDRLLIACLQGPIGQKALKQYYEN
jgi:ABC-type phosphate transport system substrate-binding protein